ncbi:ATP-binding protein [Streptomyces sp. NPDC048643]|uniref:AlbA family DNA-binding domain-containing protein n=1 Tax=Streptomyces sp. NPDC048643 TaxID=3155637 RepID=UPI003434E8A9
MALPARLTAALGSHPDELSEDDLQRAVDNRIPEGLDLDWKKDFYKGTDAGKKELAKDVSAMANTSGGMIVIGVDDGKQDHAHGLAPSEPDPNRGEEWIRSVLANWIQPVVPNVGVRPLRSALHEGSAYWLLTVPSSTQAPHAVSAPGNDYNFRVHVRHGTTTRTLAESEIAQRYRDRFQAASADADHLREIADAGLRHLGSQLSVEVPIGGSLMDHEPGWMSLTAVPTVRGNYPLTRQTERAAAFDRFQGIAVQGVTRALMPRHPILAGRRQLRFEGSPTGHLHQDGSFWSALPLNIGGDRRSPEGPKLLYQHGLELGLVAQVQAAAAWAAETGAAGDIMFEAALHHYGGSDVPLRLATSADAFQRGPVSPVPATPAQTTADLAALTLSKQEAVVVAHILVSDLLADMGAHEPELLTADGSIAADKLNSEWRAELTGWH